MKKIAIRKIKDIYNLKYKYETYDEITIYTQELKYKGVLRYAFKYAYWSLRIHGKLTILDEAHRSYGKKVNYIDFWQIRHELFNSLKGKVELIALDNENGKLELLKKSSEKSNNGISFCIVFSGSAKEIPLLKQSIDSIVEMNIDSEKYEIVVLGSSDFKFYSLSNNYPQAIPLRYLPYDFEQTTRLLITKKKNYMLDNAKYNIVSINHTRIAYAKDFYKKLIDRNFDLITTKIIGNVKGKNYSFLDFGLIGDYDILKPSKVQTFVGNFIDRNYMFLMRNRVPFIDGGLTIFNKNNTSAVRYNENIAWGEAEDVELCSTAYHDGLLIDYFDDIVCESKVLKFIPIESIKGKVKRVYLLFLAKMGLK